MSGPLCDNDIYLEEQCALAPISRYEYRYPVLPSHLSIYLWYKNS
jgi:hypothetical protein